MPETDILIIGGGIAGASTACYLSLHGRQVTLLERGDVASEASGVNAGGLGGIGWGNNPDLQSYLTMGSLELFKNVQLDHGYDIEFRLSGGLQAIHNQEQYEFSRDKVLRLRSQGYNLELLTAREARAIEPEVNPELPGFIYLPGRGGADPVKTTRAFAAAAQRMGDGAAALLVSGDGVIASLEGAHSITENMLDSWRSAGDPFVRTWEDRFAAEEGLERILEEAVSGFLRKQGLDTGAVTKIALYAPDGRRHSQLSRSVGFEPEQVQDPLFGKLGNTGAAFPLMLLVTALEAAAPEQLLLTVSYGDGSDVLGFRTTEAIAELPPRMGVSGYLEAKRQLSSYETYARWRNVWVTDGASRRPAAASPSVTALWRESDKNLRLYGATCNQCSYVQYPAQRVCVNCQTRDDATPVRFSDRAGSVFTYSMDYLAGTTDSPLVITAVDFEGGGRILCMMTDRELDEVHVGMPVEMSFRKLRVVNGIHNYYWKAVPQRSTV